MCLAKCLHGVRWKQIGSNFIPGKCFLLFQAHGLAHVQPQTQCTITSAAKEEGGKMKQKGKKAIWNSRLKKKKAGRASQKQVQSIGWHKDIWLAGKHRVMLFYF